mmetsp:Transcript_19787/g.54757  ORF Transcript_19787/g.54757 Transcript_19787/m.54757 type:complete len:353 (-) Transcript_19787:51-1109(-)
MHTRPALLLLTLWRAVDGLGLSAPRGRGAAPRAPRTVFVAVMSARGSEEKRTGSRPLWHRVEKEGHATVRYVICNDTSHDDDPAAVTKALKAEAKRFHDLVFLKCEEGYSHGRLTLKVLASMKYFHSRRKQMDLFMKVDDDSFVAWSRLHKLLNSLKTTSMKYIGHPLGPCNATRESNNRWYEPPDVYPNVSYPRTMAGGVGYLLGKDLIHEIMLDKEKNPQEGLLWNEDRGTAIWVYNVQNRNISVKPVSFRAYPYTMKCDSTWGSYPFLAQGSLSGRAIACLSAADAANQSDRSIAGCFSEECRNTPGDWVAWDTYANQTPAWDTPLDVPSGCNILNDSAVKGGMSPTRC